MNVEDNPNAPRTAAAGKRTATKFPDTLASRSARAAYTMKKVLVSLLYSVIF